MVRTRASGTTGSRKIARRVVAKVEFYFGELFPRVGFIVTTLETDSHAVVRFYNKRGTAEQWIKEGKQAAALTTTDLVVYAINMDRTGRHAAPLKDSLCLCDTLRMTARAVSTVYDDALRPLGLRVTQFSLLARAASMGPVESWRLSEALGLDKTTLPRNLRPLERRGLIAIEPGEDRRTRLVRVTPAGDKLLKEAVTCWRSVQASFKKRLHGDGFDRTLRQLLAVKAVARH